MKQDQQRLIAQLSEDLVPVRPIPRLRFSLGIVLVLWAGLVSYVAYGGRGRAALGGALSDPLFAGVLTGLVLAALGGCIAALASGTPGRESLARRSLAASGAGVLGSLVLASAFALTGGSQGGDTVSAALMCVRNGMVLAALPAAALAFLMGRGWVARPMLAAALVSVGAASLGVLIVHVSCPLVDARHIALGHTSVPLVVLGLATVPLGLLLRRTAR